MNSRSYKIITFGCQMNEHDSEVISGMLTQRGYTEAAGEGETAKAPRKRASKARAEEEEVAEPAQEEAAE